VLADALLAAVAALAAALPAPLPAPARAPAGEPVRTVRAVDLERLQGRWYAVATKRTSAYQAACRDRTESIYRLRRGGPAPAIAGINRCRRFDGRTTGDAIDVRVADRRTNAVLYVTTYGGTPERPNYLVAGLGRPGRLGAPRGRYAWLVIDAPDRSEAWIMARDPRRTLAVLREAAPAARRAGIDLADLLLKAQPGSDAIARGFTRASDVATVLARTAKLR